MTKRGDALTKALETTTTPGRSIIDILTTSDTTCTACEGPGARPRTWDTPHGQARGWYCDPCEERARRALVYLRAGRVTKAIQEIERMAS